jgi:mRNA-degrading endonuclease RelE of RelBE toxin-antitoxin system
VRLHEDAEDDLTGLDNDTRKRVIDRLKKLAHEPRGGPNATALGSAGFRVRIGNYRARYLVRDDDRTVIVTRVLRRNEATYK